MSFLGTLEQINLPLLLQRIEEYRRTGVLVVRQNARLIEFYFRDGRLLCIGPVRSDTTLGDRLVKATVISSEVLRETLDASGEPATSETRLAIILMELGYITRDDLRAWASKEAAGVLQIVCAWQQGDVYLEEGTQPQADRLLISLSIASLLPKPRSSKPVAPDQPAADSLHASAPPLRQVTMPESIANQPPTPAYIAELITETPRITLNLSSEQMENVCEGVIVTTITPPQIFSSSVSYPIVDTTFLRPEMVLFPADMETVGQQHAQLPITPEQWRVLTRVNGQTTLGGMCQELFMPVDVVRRAVGELLAMRLVRVNMPQYFSAPPAPTPLVSQPVAGGASAMFCAPPYAAAAVQTALGMNSPSPAITAPLAIETESQWGNGGNGASFVRGQGWVMHSQTRQSSGALYPAQQLYAGVSAGR